MRSIRPVQKVIDAFEALPGIGPKSAARLAYYLLNVPQEKLSKFAQSLENLKKDTKLCALCFNVGEEEFCPVCEDESRDKSLVCVVETSLDLLAFERADGYKGVYHVLGGSVNPLAGIGPNDLRIPQLMARLKTGEIKELILATNPNMEGEATAMYIMERIKELGLKETVKVTRIGRGLPTGADIEYADGQTLTRALEGRGEM
ncbi:recombination protein RecR [Candidatus Collierbacteria bacterium RIFOXYB2_FULL_46_14]|uniref:Recombination protein RecR n=1 Tax=Candidatus Collierbacteria bacterium GW2011_GWA2_46_26 TaxID=1618381 RepID=A0A0G1PK65_9BACT|nr:MAG: Recombination protein RecR [Candidatus Collierbacteria bacterium GW2011_GWC2_44_13]KKU33111.1 MAG: Recombination protein RecR [Candidatus Collierbacteria bacterium GW2011_GWA2_46_26]OGD73409.1 MAG: recombination protein RecR [Candidatus Collierbacteria bacterium RIFOXYB2_FULL_46_14]OGD76451.1 MAG: recombination protein RecR [Candidatus Collierbacteria bacterium RIFOXYA2_FULL_46_20]OGD77787.1 MAG: recombination protein RecR [Candidatus Collierbacteria bacterium RIFOXYC2_FULL_43_15]OGD81